MRDNYGDKIEVRNESFEVHIEVTDHFAMAGEPAIAALTPAKARKLAKKLKAAANEIDPPAPVAPKIGDTVEILEGDKSQFHPIGSIGEVVADGGGIPNCLTVKVGGEAQIVKTSALKVVQTAAPVIVKTPRYALDLSVEEAETLAVILSKIGGATGHFGAATSARIHASYVADKLRALGLDWKELADRPEYALESGHRDAIYFADLPVADDEPDSDPNEPRSGGCCGGVCG